jgi:hypothetical protein
VSGTRQAYIKSDAVDPRGLAAMEALETAVRHQRATEAKVVGELSAHYRSQR